MKRCLLILAAAWALAGCAAHYQRAGGDRVDFYLRAPGARSVHLMVDDDTFQAVQAVRTRWRGTWKTTLNRHRTFNYFYLVDGEPYVPECAFKERDDFGGYNCVYSP